MRSFYVIALAIILLPIPYFTGLPKWLTLIPTTYLAWIFLTSSWYVIKRTFLTKIDDIHNRKRDSQK